MTPEDIIAWVKKADKYRNPKGQYVGITDSIVATRPEGATLNEETLALGTLYFVQHWPEHPMVDFAK